LIVLGILDQNRNGLSAADIKNKAGNHPNAPASMREHGQYIYTVLGKLEAAGRIIREGGLYILPVSSPSVPPTEENSSVSSKETGSMYLEKGRLCR
jgi:hypothetical protein